MRWASDASPFGGMQTIDPSQLIDVLTWRYATKQFDPARKIPSEIWETLEDALVLSPSSYGLQPWQFFVVTDPAVKAALRPHSWDQSQVTDCSHHVVFAIRTTLEAEFVDKYISRIAEVRGVETSAMDFLKGMITADILEGPRSKIVQEWATRQAYIALGNFMTSAAFLGVDTCPMEGFDPAKYDEILGLPAKGYKAVVACPAGYRADTDKYASLPKVRFDKNELIQHI